MAIKYKWRVNKLECIPSADGFFNIVKKVHWQFDGYDEDMWSATRTGIAELNSPDPAAFVAYDDLSEDLVIQWVQSTIGGQDQITALQNEIASDISALKSPPLQDRDLPWIAKKVAA